MAEPLVFAHANGFPSATYGKVFTALAEDFEVRYLPQHGHDARFPVGDNWVALVDELLDYLQRQHTPVWGVGHSLGGVLHLHAALRCPAYYQGLILLDAPLFGARDRWAIRAAKRLGLIDRLTPAGRTLGRREHFPEAAAARAYFAGKALFRAFDPECLDAYVHHGLTSDHDGLRLAFDPAVEIAIYRAVPHVSPQPSGRLALPLALIVGEQSNVVPLRQVRAARRLPHGESHQVAGGHMFPLERPLETAELIRSIVRRWQRERLTL